VYEAREQVGQLVGARAPDKEIVFTSGATEADNLALKGVAHANGSGHIITQKTEHKAVIDAARRLEREGFAVTWLDVDGEGFVDPEDVRRAIRPDTIIVSVMYVNNEVGTVQPIEAIGAITREHGIPLHTDAAQAMGRVEVDVERLNIDLLSLSGHKMYAPKGVGALYVRRSGPLRVRLVAEMDGGGHERGMRSGTLNVPGIVGLGTASRLAREQWRSEARELARLRQRLYQGIVGRLEEVRLNGPSDFRFRHPGNLNLSFGYVEGEALILALQSDLAVSSGAACSSASLEPSYVLHAMGVDRDLASASVRFGLGRGTTEAEVDRAIEVVVASVEALRARSPLWELRAEGAGADALDW
jgi:cysteine desulfurase